MVTSVSKFDSARSGEYAVQSRIALAGYDACHELAACLLSASLGAGSTARVLVAGAGGTAQEIISAGRLEPNWRFTSVDPSPPMLSLARAAIEAAGLSERTDFFPGLIEDCPETPTFDAATLIGVLHHLPTLEAKELILADLAARLKPGAPLILACNRGAYASRPLFLSAWGRRWRLAGESEEAVEARLGKILEGAEPPPSDAAVAALLQGAGFVEPELFFSSLFWGAWIARLERDPVSNRI